VSFQVSRRQRVHNKGHVAGNIDPKFGNEDSYHMRDSPSEAIRLSITVTHALLLVPLPQSTSQEATTIRDSRNEDLIIDNESLKYV
jgi:hypothetical protein